MGEKTAQPLSYADIALLIILALGAFFGYRKGFLMELFYLLALLLGVWLGFKLMAVAMEYLAREFNADRVYLPYIAFFTVFLIVVIVVVVLGRWVSDRVDKTFLGRVDEIAGALLGLFKYTFCISIVLWLMRAVSLELPQGWTAGSWLYPQVVDFAPRVTDWFASFLPFLKEIFRDFKNG